MAGVDDLYVVRFGLPGSLSLDELDHAEQDAESATEDTEPDIKTTFAQFGSAYYHANVLEHEIVNILAMSRIVTAQRDAERLFSDPWDDKTKATMGKLVKELEPHTQTDPELATDIIEALRLRNYLAHSFWRERADDFCSEAGRARMIDFLIATRNHFQDVERRLSKDVGAPTFRQWGMTPEAVEAWYQDKIAQVERGELDVPPSTIDSARRDLLARATDTPTL